VLVGAGIGVTPFASILKDLVFVTHNGPDVSCRKVSTVFCIRDKASEKLQGAALKTKPYQNIFNKLSLSCFL